MTTFKPTCCLVLCLLTAVFSKAQTKLIAHKSHSGTAATFKIAYETGSFDIENSNFGMAPERMVTNSSLDSVIFISDTVAIMVTSEYCRRRNSTQAATTKWRAGK